MRDVIVVGRPSERWGSEPVAIVSLEEEVSDADLLATAADHFDVWPGKAWFDAASAHQVAFLTRVLGA